MRNICQLTCEMEFFETLHDRDQLAIQSIRNLYFSTENSDITLLCEGVEVKAHKFVLSFHSEVFKSVLEGNLGSDCFVSLPDTSWKELDFLLSLMYFRNVPDFRGNDSRVLDLIRRLKVGIPEELLIIKEEITESSELIDFDVKTETNSSETLEGDYDVLSQLENFVGKDQVLEAEDVDDEKEDHVSFSELSSLESHFKSKRRREGAVSCDLCNKRFRNEMMLSIHREEHQQEVQVTENGRLCCNKCDKTFKDIYKLRAHKIIHVQGLYSCDRCDIEFSNFHSLKFHLKHHDLYYDCDECSKRYRAKNLLMEHKLTVHHGLKLKCNYCEKRYTGASNLAKHVKAAHLGQTYDCELCEYTAKRSSTLKNHIQNNHPTEDSVVHRCELCSFETYSPKYLRRHLLSCKRR